MDEEGKETTGRMTTDGGYSTEEDESSLSRTGNS